MRNNAIDILRGIAILIMVSANSWSYVYPFETCPTALRIVFSSAAPLFIFLSGVSVHISLNAGRSLNNIRKRALQVLLIGIFIDVCIWNIYPFVTFDVLYLISLSTLIMTLLAKSNLLIQLIFMLSFFVSNIFFLKYYEFNMPDLSVIDKFPNYGYDTFKRLFLDGWFPLLPWTGFVFLGFLVAKHLLFIKKYKILFLFIGVLCFLFYAYFLFFTNLTEMPPLREDYIEVFYPVKGSFWIYLAGLIFFSIFFINTPITDFELIANLGKTSLSIYLFHTIIIKFVLSFFEQSSKNFNVWVMAGGLTLFYVLIILFNAIVVKYKNRLKTGKYRVLGYLIGI